jgi:hypothetical protein
VVRVPELPLTEAERRHIEAQPNGALATLSEIGQAIVEMPTAMRKLALMSAADLLDDGDMEENIPVQAGDVVIIPESMF